jgi:hypothetical protein
MKPARLLETQLGAILVRLPGQGPMMCMVACGIAVIAQFLMDDELNLFHFCGMSD